MKARLLPALLAAAMLAAAPAALAGDMPRPSPNDPRVRIVTYAADQVVQLKGHYGFQIMLEFAPDERIENVAIGDSLAWQVTPNRRADTLFLKPIEPDATTNLAVVTTQRRYAFVLTASEAFGADDPELMFRVRFTYPQEQPSAAPAGPEEPVTVANDAYSVSGSTRNIPSRIFDDGKRTFMRWPEGAATPAVFAVAADGSESVVNFNMRGPVMVVERVAPAFILRNGTEQTIVHNDGWREPTLGPDAPKVRSTRESGSLFRRLFGRNPPKAQP